jgi:hypothetical protein
MSEATVELAPIDNALVFDFFVRGEMRKPGIPAEVGLVPRSVVL